ncbi:MAG: pyridoxamine 5'-phosphate oxidase [bacterium]
MSGEVPGNSDVGGPAFLAPPPLAGMRVAYRRGELTEADLRPTWSEQFDAWFADAVLDERVVEPNAIQLATADAAGRPSVRTVLAKAVTADGLVFFTNHDSAKGRDLAAQPWAEAVFAWLPLERQVRLAGRTAPVPRAETEAYFATRPRESQLGAWASTQSHVVAGRDALDAALAAVEQRFAGMDVVPPPPGWSGFRLRPERAEFWQGRMGRMHDRLQYRLDGSTWRVERLAP